MPYRNSLVTHCPAGHEYAGDNLVIAPTSTGGTARRCRTCRREQARARIAHNPRVYPSPERRLIDGSVIDPESGCRRWQGWRTDEGYGRLNIDGKLLAVHRLAYEIWVGPIPDGMVIDHVRARGCEHRDCINPAHLEAVEPGENSRRGNRGLSRSKASCIKGHAMAGDNVYSRYLPERQITINRCRTCQRDHQARRRESTRKGNK